MFSERYKINQWIVWLFLFGLLMLNFCFNFFNSENAAFENYQLESEMYVVGPIEAQYYLGGTGRSYGLGYYNDILGMERDYTYYNREDYAFLSNEEYNAGYSVDGKKICLPDNSFTESRAIEGNSVLFANGVQYTIAKSVADDIGLVVYFDSEEGLSKENCGSLIDIQFVNADGTIMEKGKMSDYSSSYGLQGKAFQQLSRILPHGKVITIFHWGCSALTAIIFLMIVCQIRKKYNALMAVCFFVTFWLSPWTTQFARNLYWIEFSWFIPMLIGLWCSNHLENRRRRIFSYAGAFLAIFFKCMCGYEYISTIMLGLIAFLIVDWLLSISDHNIIKQKLLFRTIFILGLCAVAGFILAICFHASIRGDGSIIEGIRSIYEKDVLRRTLGGNPDDFDAVYSASLMASPLKVLYLYMHFNTDVIAGIEAQLFPLLLVLPIVIMFCQHKNGNLPKVNVALYIILFVTCISWFVLGKAHSYIHTGLNYVMWYFGIVQIAFYIIADASLKLVKEYRK